ncbi:histidine phosphatase family protein [Pseudomonas putida]|uniref:histidine phosphatase family protein n=1 Tax=Pseudomonas TaxID=286 RepID=UPI0006D3A85D|nr:MULTISPECIES: histidine phosphatase family protein [Pseudomonas]MBI6942835.1 histidine phosphatase family protein [Pseudomonas putida]MBI6960614.1 histidine phosphatase family protein [Pseudomonas putida]
MTHTLYVVRHGQTQWNAQHRLQGSRDIDLNPVGRQQAAANGQTLAWLLPHASPYQLISSPMLRAANTMKAIAQALGQHEDAIRYDQRVTEISFGAWEGMTLQEVSQRMPEAFDAYETDPFAFIPMGGESYQQASVRVADFLRSVSEDTVLVTHAGVIRVLLSLMAKVEHRAATQLVIPQDQILMVQGSDYRWMRASKDLEGR